MPVPKKLKLKRQDVDLNRISSIPDQSIAKKYIHRLVGGVYDFDVFDTALHTSMNILLYGPTGPGKTMAVMAYAAERGMHFFAVPSNVGIDPTQVIGRFVPDEATGKFKFANGGATDIVENGGVLLINEVSFLPDRIATAIFGLLDARREITVLERGERVVVRAHRPDCWCDLAPDECERRWVLVAADMNPDYAGTRPLNAAFRNRFGIQIPWDYDPIVEKSLVTSEALLAFANDVRRTANQHGMFTTPVSTNMLMEFEMMVETLGYDFARDNFLGHFSVDAERAAIETLLRTQDANLRGSYKKLDRCNPVVELKGLNAGTTDDDEYENWTNENWMDT